MGVVSGAVAKGNILKVLEQRATRLTEGKHLLEAHSRANVENPLSIGSMRSRRLFQGEKSMPLPPEQLAINPQLSRITDELQLIERVRKKLNNPRTNLSHPEIRRELVDDVFPKRRTGDGAFDLMNVALLEDKAKSYLTRYLFVTD